jgi:ankyrin repeat protein
VTARQKAGQPLPRRVRGLLALCAFLTGCGTSIHDEAARGNLEQVEAMLDKDPALADAPNAEGKTPLFYAITNGREATAETLLAHGADVNARDVTGYTPLHVAATLGRTGEADLLLKHGADLEARDHFGDTPLHAAALFGKDCAIKFLIERGAELYARNDDGLTPLDLAKRARKNGTAALLEKLDTESGDTDGQ